MRIFFSITLAAAFFSGMALAENSPLPTLSSKIDAALTAASAKADENELRAFVHKSIRFEAYDGVLKGPRGAYLTKAGNGADQALLLHELIKRNHPEIALRFAGCELSAQQANELSGLSKNNARTSSVDWAGLAVAVDDTALKSRLAMVGALWEAAKVSALAHTDWIAPAAASLDTKAASDSQLKQHVWLQKNMGGEWVDLDTVPADGKPLCAPSHEWATLPDDHYETVKLSIVVEWRHDGAFSETETVTTEGRLADLSVSRISAGFAEPMGFQERRADSDTKKWIYTPAFRIDNQTFLGQPILLPPIDFGSAGDGAGGSASDAGSVLDDDASTVPVDDAPSAIWLRMTASGPAGAYVSQSAILDRVSFSARADGMAGQLPLADLVVSSNDYAAFAAFWQIGLLTGSTANPELAVMPDMEATSDGLSSIVDGLLRLYPGLYAQLSGERVPGLTVLIAGLEPTQINGEFEMTLDLLNLPRRFGSNDRSLAVDPASGLAAERLLAELAGGTIVPERDTVGIFETMRAAGTTLHLVHPGDEISTAGASSDAVARMQQRLREGKILIVPESAAFLETGPITAWWVYDPALGQIRDEHESGRHSELVEYEKTNEPPVSAFQRFCQMAARNARIIALVTFAIGITSGEEGVVDVAKAIIKANEESEKSKDVGRALEKGCSSSGAGPK